MTRIFVISGYHGVGKTSIWKEVCSQLDSQGNMDIVPIGEFARGILQDGFLLDKWANLFNEDFFDDFYFGFEKMLLKIMKHFWLYWYQKGKILVCDRSFLDILAYCQTYLDPHLWNNFFKEKIERECLELLAIKNEIFTFVLRRAGVDDEEWVENLYSFLNEYGFPYETYWLEENFENKEAIVRYILMDIEGTKNDEQ